VAFKSLGLEAELGLGSADIQLVNGWVAKSKDREVDDALDGTFFGKGFVSFLGNLYLEHGGCMRKGDGPIRLTLCFWRKGFGARRLHGRRRHGRHRQRGVRLMLRHIRRVACRNRRRR
jgi:hypothetical protein